MIPFLFAVYSCASGTPPPDERCGNGTVEANESCDGSDLAGESCDSLGFGAGTLACNSQCGFDTSGCGASSCGNLIIDQGEECDSLNLNGASCVSLGFDGGALICDTECNWDTSACVTMGCGNGVIEAGEECDDGNPQTGDGCNASCTIEPGWSCSGQPSQCNNQCGNNIVDTGEDCDGDAMGGNTCYTLGFNGGVLECAGTCRYDTSQCEGDPCGNGTIDTGEDCDGGNLNNQSCTTIPGGFTGGALGCAANCVFDTTQCTSNQCGNNTQETGEDCDGNDYGGADCVSLGYVSGTLGCQGDCTYDLSGCNASSNCGNGTVEGSEECDDGNTQSGDGCTAGCQWEQTCSADGTIACGGSESGSLILTWNDAFYYACGTSDASGEDEIYSFTATSSGVASATVTGNGGFLGNNINLYVMEGACNPQLCVSAGESTAEDTAYFTVTAGRTYYLAAELDGVGFPPNFDYTLSLTCP